MNQLEYISIIASTVHEAVEGWARNLLRDAGIETTEVYGQFPPEGSVASHIVLFPYRLGSGDTQLSQPYNETSLLRSNRKPLSPGSIPNVWLLIGQAITRCVVEQFPRIKRGPMAGRPFPAPPLELLPDPLRAWYEGQGDSGGENSWLTDLGGTKHARLPSLAWASGTTLKVHYLVVVGEGARGIAEKSSPLAIQALSVISAGAQMQRTLNIRVPGIPFDPVIADYAMAVAECFDDEMGDELRASLSSLGKKLNMAVTLLPGGALTNADFTGLMQALQRPLQPTLHLSVQLNIGGGPIFAPGISADITSDRKDRRPSGRE
jgi:hypothetical protein